MKKIYNFINKFSNHKSNISYLFLLLTFFLDTVGIHMFRYSFVAIYIDFIKKDWRRMFLFISTIVNPIFYERIDENRFIEVYCNL